MLFLDKFYSLVKLWGVQASGVQGLGAEGLGLFRGGLVLHFLLRGFYCGF